MYLNYGHALELVRQGKKVSCERWGNEGKIYVEKLHIGFTEGYPIPIEKHKFTILMLTDTSRNTKVAFTPSVENQLEDKWYEVIIMNDGTTIRKETILEKLIRERTGEKENE